MLEPFLGNVISPQSMQFFADSEADGADVSGIIVHQLHIFDPLPLLHVIGHEYQQTRMFSVGIEDFLTEVGREVSRSTTAWIKLAVSVT